jgi:hypothetical protein
MARFDVVVIGDANPDLLVRGGDVVPAFGQHEHMVEEARLAWDCGRRSSGWSATILSVGSCSTRCGVATSTSPPVGSIPVCRPA